MASVRKVIGLIFWFMIQTDSAAQAKTTCMHNLKPYLLQNVTTFVESRTLRICYKELVPYIFDPYIAYCDHDGEVKSCSLLCGTKIQCNYDEGRKTKNKEQCYELCQGFVYCHRCGTANMDGSHIVPPVCENNHLDPQYRRGGLRLDNFIKIYRLEICKDMSGSQIVYDPVLMYCQRGSVGNCTSLCNPKHAEHTTKCMDMCWEFMRCFPNGMTGRDVTSSDSISTDPNNTKAPSSNLQNNLLSAIIPFGIMVIGIGIVIRYAVKRFRRCKWCSRSTTKAVQEETPHSSVSSVVTRDTRHRNQANDAAEVPLIVHSDHAGRSGENNEHRSLSAPCINHLSTAA